MKETRNRTVIMVLFLPIIIFVWMMGWTLLWLEPNKKSRKTQAKEETLETLTVGMVPQDEIIVEN